MERQRASMCWAMERQRTSMLLGEAETEDGLVLGGGEAEDGLACGSVSIKREPLKESINRVGEATKRPSCSEQACRVNERAATVGAGKSTPGQTSNSIVAGRCAGNLRIPGGIRITGGIVTVSDGYLYVAGTTGKCSRRQSVPGGARRSPIARRPSRHA